MTGTKLLQLSWNGQVSQDVQNYLLCTELKLKCNDRLLFLQLAPFTYDGFIPGITVLKGMVKVSMPAVQAATKMLT